MDGTEFRVGLLQFELILPSAAEWKDGLVRGAIPQVPLSLANSVISVCALSHSLFGDPKDGGKGASRVWTASTIGVQNFLFCWFGAQPSCHGCGGLAAQYQFGA